MKYLLKITTNLFAVSSLLALLILPLFFAANFAKVAGEKTSAQYLAISQADNFPNLDITEENEKYVVNFTPLATPQAFLGVMTLVNPIDSTNTYYLEESASQTEVFFGGDLQNRPAKITLPPHAQTSISLYSQSEERQSIAFSIKTE